MVSGRRRSRSVSIVTSAAATRSMVLIGSLVIAPRVSDAQDVARVTKTAWFGPKRWGWGWSPASWQGWVVTIAFSIAGQVIRNATQSPRRRVVATLLLVASFFGVIALTGDPPGSRHGGTGSAGPDETLQSV